MALSEKEVKIIQDTWAPIRSSQSKWPQLFVILFNEDAEIKKQFKNFENVPTEELPANKRLKAHAASVISLISGFVDFIDDPETMVEMIESMAKRHNKRKIPLPMFDTLGVAVIKWLKEVNGDAFNEEAIAAWTKLYSALVSIVKQQYSQLNCGENK